jgi:hypothetical protein
MLLQVNAAQPNGPRPGGIATKTGLRSRRHHQHHGPGAPSASERGETGSSAFYRSETLDPVRPAGVRQRTDLHDQLMLTGNTVLVVLT